MNCPECSYDYSMFVGDFSFCPKCAERLPQLSQAARRRVQLTSLVSIVSVFVAPGLLGAGIALWFLGPAWFAYAETRTIRGFSIGLMVGGPLLFVIAVYATYLAGHLALRGSAKSLD